MDESSYAADRVRGPSIALLVTAIVGGAAQVISLARTVLGFALPMDHYREGDELPAFVSFAFGSVANLIGLAMAFVVGFAALKMQRLESYNLALVGSILAMIPCVSPCCLLGLPFGIWALVVLTDDRVKRAFR